MGVGQSVGKNAPRGLTAARAVPLCLPMHTEHSSGGPSHCGDCGRLAVGSGSMLHDRGWILLRMRSAVGAAVSWLRCPRCVAGGAHAVGETLV